MAFDGVSGDFFEYKHRVNPKLEVGWCLIEKIFSGSLRGCHR